jgi:hypothetical protein
MFKSHPERLCERLHAEVLTQERDQNAISIDPQ